LLEHFGEDRVSSESRIYQVEEEGLEAVLVRLENVVCRKRKGKFRIRDVKDPEIEFSFYKDEAYWIDGWPSKPTRVWTSIYVDPAKPQIRLDMPCRWAYM